MILFFILEGCQSSYIKYNVVGKEVYDRAALESSITKGEIIVVQLDGSDFNILKHCKAVDNRYQYTGVQPKTDFQKINSESQIGASYEVLQEKLNLNLTDGSEVVLLTRVVGRYDALNSIKKVKLQGDCEDATHIVSGGTVGSFMFVQGDYEEIKSEAENILIDVNVRSYFENKILYKDGNPEKCLDLSSKPIDYCKAILRIDLIELEEDNFIENKIEEEKEEEETNLEKYEEKLILMKIEDACRDRCAKNNYVDYNLNSGFMNCFGFCVKKIKGEK
jgi:hypothetical protein